MRIEAAEVRHVAMPLIRPWRTAYGQDATIHSVLVRLSTGHMDAWGESCPLYAPTYSPESACSVFETCREFLLPRVVGNEFRSAADLLECLAVFRGNPFAKAAVETAWWVLEAKRREVPLWQALGGTRSAVLCGDDFGIQDSIDELLALIEQAVSRGPPRIKLKIMHGWDIEVLRAVRSAFPRIVMHVDCNAGYELESDVHTLQSLDEFALAMIEQPLSDTDLVEHAKLQRRLQTPICLDESIKGPRDFRAALELGACRAINIKPGRVGGLSNAVQIHDMARNAGMTAWVGGMLESGVGASICAALATLPGFTYPADLFPSKRFYSEYLEDSELVLDSDWRFDLRQVGPGGCEPNQERLQRFTVASHLLTQKDRK